jgi:hypothetical protein
LAVLFFLLLLAASAFAQAQHRELYSVGCRELWPAVREGVTQAQGFTDRRFNDPAMTTSYAVADAKGNAHRSTVSLLAQGSSCVLELESTFRAIYGGSEAGKLKKQIDAALERRRTGAPEPPADGAPATAAAAKHAAAPARPAGAQLTLDSTPGGAQIELDGTAAGLTPATLSLAPGEHTIVLRLSGYKDWEHKLHAGKSPIKWHAKLSEEGSGVHWF